MANTATQPTPTAPPTPVKPAADTKANKDTQPAIQQQQSVATQAVKRTAENTPIAPLDRPKDNINPSNLKRDVLKVLEGAPLTIIQQKKLDEVLAQHESGRAQARNPYQENPHINAPHVLPAVNSPIVKETTSPGTLDRLEPTLASKAEPNPVTEGKIPEIKPDAAKAGEVPTTINSAAANKK